MCNSISAQGTAYQNGQANSEPDAGRSASIEPTDELEFDSDGPADVAKPDAGLRARPLISSR